MDRHSSYVDFSIPFICFFRRRLRKKRKMWISGTFQAIILFSTRKPKQNVCSHYLIKLYVLDLAQRQANCTYNGDVYHISFILHSISIELHLFWTNFSDDGIFRNQFWLYMADRQFETTTTKKSTLKYTRSHTMYSVWKRWSNGIKCTKLCNKNGIANKSLVAIEWSVRTHTHTTRLESMCSQCEYYARI